jgi:hypothetical protein
MANGSFVKGAAMTYETPMGVYFWPILVFVLLVAVGIKTESPPLVGILAIVAHVVMATLLPIETSFIFYISIALSVGLTLYFFYASSKTY